jgi:uncharacterized protein (DUF1330 family)
MTTMMLLAGACASGDAAEAPVSPASTVAAADPVSTRAEPTTSPTVSTSPVATATVVATAAEPAVDAPLPERLAAAYPDPGVEPSEAAWAALLADPAFATAPVTVFEFVRLHATPGAKAGYDTFVVALAAAIESVGGQLLGVNDTLFAGVGELPGYANGTSWVASFPSAAAFAEAMVAPSVVAAADSRRTAVVEAQLMAGANLVPALLLELPAPGPAENYPRDRVLGKPAAQIVDELLTVYPDGGADPTRATLEKMVSHLGFLDDPVAYINLYRFNADAEGGEAALNEYNTEALPFVLAHGARPKAVVNVAHHLAGPTEWDRIIYVRWPSMGVFTDLRLDPGYLAAQEARVQSGEEYGNLVGVPRLER